MTEKTELQKLEEAIDRISYWQSGGHCSHPDIETIIEAAKETAQLRAVAGGLVEALQFYAARENLSAYDNGFIYEIVEDGDEVEIGTIAKQALAAYQRIKDGVK